jgi:hypothetical protein
MRLGYLVQGGRPGGNTRDAHQQHASLVFLLPEMHFSNMRLGYILWRPRLLPETHRGLMRLG